MPVIQAQPVKGIGAWNLSATGRRPLRLAPWESTIEASGSATESLRTLRTFEAQETCIQNQTVDCDTHSPRQRINSCISNFMVSKPLRRTEVSDMSLKSVIIYATIYNDHESYRILD